MESDPQYFDLILLGVIAVALILRLNTQLGKRNGHEKPSGDFTYQSKEDGLPKKKGLSRSSDAKGKRAPVLGFGDGKAKSTSRSKSAKRGRMASRPLSGSVSGSALSELPAVLRRLHDFNIEEFLERAEEAFVFIVQAFAVGDRSALRGLLKAEIYADLDNAITEREKNGETVMLVVERFLETRVVDVSTKGRKVYIKVLFKTEQAMETQDKDNKVIAGDSAQLIDKSDVWTFCKDLYKKDPTWLLVATDICDEDHDGVPDQPTSIVV